MGKTKQTRRRKWIPIWKSIHSFKHWNVLIWIFFLRLTRLIKVLGVWLLAYLLTSHCLILTSCLLKCLLVNLLFGTTVGVVARKIQSQQLLTHFYTYHVHPTYSSKPYKWITSIHQYCKYCKELSSSFSFLIPFLMVYLMIYSYIDLKNKNKIKKSNKYFVL